MNDPKAGPDSAVMAGTVAQSGDPQSAIVDFLLRPGVIASSEPKVHETHIARVFVGPQRALKIKRAVKLAFLDFSTLEKRHAACLSEMVVNQSNAPEIYLGVVAITKGPNGDLAIGGRGQPVEWAVDMLPFNDNDLLSERAKAGPLSRILMQQTADAVQEMHARSPVRREADLVAKMHAIVTEVSDVLSTHAGFIPADELARWRALATGAIGPLAPVLAARVASGAVRRCHGDLHLANIVVWKGLPTLFDALEFSEEMATVDTLYDLAFLLMDLVHHGQRSAANTVLNRYLWRSGTLDDLRALALLPLYVSCRAGIRAMVAASRTCKQAGLPSSDHSNRALSARYLAEAVEVLTPRPTRLVAVGGLSGSGKSTLASQLAPRFTSPAGALHLRSDLERKALMGVEETFRLPAESYTAESAALVYERLLARAGAALAAGHSVIVDAVFARPEERQRIQQIAADHGADFHGIWLEAPAGILRQRVAERRGDASDATPEVVERQLSYPIGALDWSIIRAGGSIEQTAQSTARLLHI